jgi:pyridoxal phosphate enzyme (YggS family)
VGLNQTRTEEGMQTELEERFRQVRRRIQQAAERAGRLPSSVRLVTVSKTQPAALVRAAINAGATILGENYIQEARDKFNAFVDSPASWHFIGHLQSNKAKYAVRMFDLIHTVDSAKLAVELDRQAARVGKVQQVLLQVNISGEATKSGTGESGLIPLVEEICRLANLKIRGLMTMPPFFDAPERARSYFAALRGLRDRIQDRFAGDLDFRELSMGMTGDFEVAIEEGATLVRIGTALFGERS